MSTNQARLGRMILGGVAAVAAMGLLTYLRVQDQATDPDSQIPQDSHQGNGESEVPKGTRSPLPRPNQSGQLGLVIQPGQADQAVPAAQANQPQGRTAEQGAAKTPMAAQAVEVAAESFATVLQALPLAPQAQKDLLPKAHKLLASLGVVGNETAAGSHLTSERIELRYSRDVQSDPEAASNVRGQPVRFLCAQIKTQDAARDFIRQDLVISGGMDLFEETYAAFSAKLGRPPDHTRMDPNGGQNFVSWDAPSGFHLWVAWNPLEENPANQGVRITIEENIHPQP